MVATPPSTASTCRGRSASRSRTTRSCSATRRGTRTPETLDAVTSQIDGGRQRASASSCSASCLPTRDCANASPRCRGRSCSSTTRAPCRTTAGCALARKWRSRPDPTKARVDCASTRSRCEPILAPNLRLIFVYSTELHEAATIEAKVAEVAATIRAPVDGVLVGRRPRDRAGARSGPRVRSSARSGSVPRSP